MSYMAAQSLLKTLIQTCTSFAAGTVVEGDSRILDRGVASACILSPGELPAFDLSAHVRERQYVALADVVIRVAGEADVYNDLGTLRDAVIATIQAGRCLSGTYFVIAISGDEPFELADKTGSVVLAVMTRLRITIQENV